MNHWPVQIYAVSDNHAQELIVGLLSGIDELSVDAATNGSGHFVIVECGDRVQSRSVSRLITSIDFGATPVRAGRGRSEPLTVRQALAG